MFRTATCGELRLSDAGKSVTLAGWVQKMRNLGAMAFIDLRDRYGITQITVDEHATDELKEIAGTLGREFVLQVTGTVTERSSKNDKIPTGEIEIIASQIKILNASETPPFTIEEHSDGGDELRMKYRYLDLRRAPLQRNMILRHKLAQQIRNYLDGQGFLEIETPYLIKSTPEGARDFIVPSRMNPSQFYALPQSPQTFKQLLMVSGYDRYFQIVRCFRDEDLRADRQPEFTQIDCEMAFVDREDVIDTFEGMMKSLFKQTLGLELGAEAFPRISWKEAMERYGCDKPDIRFGMEFRELTPLAKDQGFVVFDQADYIGAICAPGCACYTRKQIDQLTDFVKRPQVGAKGLVYVRCEADGSFKSSVDKFFTPGQLGEWAAACGAQPGDLLLILAGEKFPTLNALCALRLEVAEQLGLREGGFAPLWVVDFPLLEWDEETKRYYAMHHPFTSPKEEDRELFMSGDLEKLGQVRAEAYDFVLNGVEVGGGSIRIFDEKVQNRMFEMLGFTKEQAQEQFGFLLGAFKYGAPPHGGIAFGFDRLCAVFAGIESIRDFIAFPKNNSGRDVMIDAPSTVDPAQLDELSLTIKK